MSNLIKEFVKNVFILKEMGRLLPNNVVKVNFLTTNYIINTMIKRIKDVSIYQKGLVKHLILHNLNAQNVQLPQLNT